MHSLTYFVIAFRVRITGNLLFVCYFGRKRFCIYSKARVEIGFRCFGFSRSVLYI
jgi:hypothetical protein